MSACVWVCMCMCARVCIWVIHLGSTSFQVVAVQHCGELSVILNKPGMTVLPALGYSSRTVSLKRQSLDLPTSKIVDVNGSPLQVCAYSSLWHLNEGSV